MVQADRNINIEWKPFSLAIKNNELKDLSKNSKYTKIHKSSHRILRVMLQANKLHNSKLIDLYTEFGINYHIIDQPFDDNVIKKVLKQKSLPLSLLKFADDEALDIELRKTIKDATNIVGEDIGVPTIIFNKGGQKLGYFGPVLQELPDKEEAIKLWDGLVGLVSTNSFYELKRSRPDGQPDVFSTAKC